MIPSVDTCIDLMKKYQMPEHIRDHSFVVAKVARLIARGLRISGLEISLEKVTAGALMHDIGKKEALDKGVDHSKIGKEICLHNRLDDIADIVAEHVRLKDNKPNSRLSEKEIVYYADKRVNHDKIVSLSERKAYIVERYSMDRAELRQRIVENFDFCKRLEKRIFSKLNFQPEELAWFAGKEHISGEEFDNNGCLPPCKSSIQR